MEGKNILVFRTAKHPVVLQCIDYIKEKYPKCKIFLCVQEECIKTYNKISDVKIIKFPNGFFNYDKTKNNKRLNTLLHKLLIDTVFIPYTADKPECPEVLKIVSRYTKIKRVFYFNRFKIVKVEMILLDIIKSKLKKIIIKMSGCLELILLKSIYTIYARR